jgi:hypothetical protein
MNPWLNNVTYGNPVDEFLPYLKTGAYQSVYEQLKDNPFPPNDSEATQDELRELIAYQNLPEQKDEKIISRYMGYNQDLVTIFKKYVTDKIGENLDSEIDGLIEDSKFLLMKLKFFYQRPRPYQVAQYYKAKLFPFKSGTSYAGRMWFAWYKKRPNKKRCSRRKKKSEQRYWLVSKGSCRPSALKPQRLVVTTSACQT